VEGSLTSGLLGERLASTTNIAQIRQKSSKLLLEYLSSWTDDVPREVIGGLLYLLGGDAPLQTRLDELLEGQSREKIRTMLGWVDAYQTGYQGASPIVCNVTLEPSSSVQVISVAGSPIRVPLSKEINGLMVGRHTISRSSDGTVINLTLRQIRSVDYQKRLAEIILKTAENLVDIWRSLGANIDKANFAELWHGFEDAAQFGIELAQAMLKRHAVLILRQLALGTRQPGDRLQQLLSSHGEAERTYVDTKLSKSAVSSPMYQARKDAEKELDRITDEIGGLIERDLVTQDNLISAVRGAIGRHFQYRSDSVLFELFQNADDAALELEKLYAGTEVHHGPKACLVWTDENGLGFGHWGRSINEFKTKFSDRRDLEFERDLEKMLVMHDSSKTLQEGSIDAPTGRFGLGFKSVFLETRLVHVVSDRLAFEIVGGMYPRRLDLERAVLLRGRVTRDSRVGTAIWLQRPQTEAPGTWSLRILDRFNSCLPLLLAFSQRIKSCELSAADGSLVQHRWVELPLFDRVRVFSGEFGARRFMVLRGTGAKEGVLFSMGPGGIEPLPSQLPRCWVTTPLRENPPVDFAFSAPFAPDIGRNSLAQESSDNDALAETLGRAAGDALAALYQQMNSEYGWSHVRSTLGITQASNRADFWRSLWKALEGAVMSSPQGESPSSRIARLVACRILHQLASLPIVPTGLFGEHASLTSVPEIRNYCDGILSDKRLFQQAAPLLSLEPGAIVSEERHRVLLQLGLHGYTPSAFTLLSLLIARVGDVSSRVDSEVANDLGKIFDLSLLQNTRGHVKEIAEIQNVLLQLLFPSQVGSHELADSLLILDDADESLIAAFAPPARVASKSLKTSGVSLLRAARTKPTASISITELAGWANSVTDTEGQIGVLRYFLRHPRGSELAFYLQSEGSGWWDTILESTVVNERFGSEDARKLHMLLAFSQLARVPQRAPGWSADPFDVRGVDDSAYPDDDSNNETPVSVPVVPSPSEFRPRADSLQRIYDWWCRESGERLADYEARVYPRGTPPQWIQRPHEEQELQDWMELFILGCLHTMGRARSEHHRGFLVFAHDQSPDWIAKFVEANLPREFWVDLLDTYLDPDGPDGKWYNWICRLPAYYQLSHWLRTYCLLFSTADQLDRIDSLDLLLTPSSNPALRGAVEWAPSLRRVLGSGSCFVLRELVRTRVLNGTQFYQHCFVPTGDVCDVIESLSGPKLNRDEKYDNSRAIYRWLAERLGPDKATFGLAFDIPFKILAEETDLFRDLVSSEAT
jgi:hypothetical protein